VPDVVPLVSKARAARAGSNVVSVVSLKASAGTAGIACHDAGGDSAEMPRLAQ